MSIKNTKREYYLKNRDHILKRNAAYRARKTQEISDRGKEYYAAHREEKKRQRRERLQQIKMKAFDTLGGVCVHCGFNDPRALQIDHVNGNGKHDHPKRDDKYYKHVIGEAKHGSPKYQLLCANCNWIKRHECGEHGKQR